MKIYPEKLSKKIQEIALAKDWKQFKQLMPSSEIERLSLGDKEKIALCFQQQGQILWNAAEDIGQLEAAIMFFEKALQLDPLLKSSWLMLAQANLKLGLLKTDEHFYNEAHAFFMHAESLFHMQNEKFSGEILWDWGLCLYFIAKQTQEALDFKLSIEKFHEAYALGLENTEFFLNFGSALGELGVLIGKDELILEAIRFFECSLKEDGENALAWLRMACSYKILYFHSGDVGYYEKADQSFVAAARLDVEQSLLWLNWGQLLSLEGKTVRDEALLSAALDKLEKADNLQPNDPVILITLADTYMHLGALMDRLDLLKEAKVKLEFILSQTPEHLDALNLLGHCYIHLGQYFSDLNYINLAIGKFQLGLSRNKQHYVLWHGLAMAYFTLGELTKDPSAYKKAAKFYAQAIHLGADHPAYWNDWGVALMKYGDITNNVQFIIEASQKFEETFRIYHKSHAGNPDPDWIYNYGCALDFLGEYEHNPHYYEKSIAVLSELHEHYPDVPHIRYNLAIALYHFGDIIGDEEALKKSIEHLEWLVKRDPEDDNALTDLGLVYLTLADIYSDSFINERLQYCYHHAARVLSQALGCGGVEANYWMACLHAMQENVSEAMHFLERARLSNVLPEIKDLLNNEWLEVLKPTSIFQDFLNSLDAKQIDEI